VFWELLWHVADLECQTQYGSATHCTQSSYVSQRSASNWMTATSLVRYNHFFYKQTASVLTWLTRQSSLIIAILLRWNCITIEHLLASPATDMTSKVLNTRSIREVLGDFWPPKCSQILSRPTKGTSFNPWPKKTCFDTFRFDVYIWQVTCVPRPPT